MRKLCHGALNGPGLRYRCGASTKYGLLFEFEDHRVDGEAVAGLRVDLLHHAGFLGAQDILHLHRLDDRERLAGLDLVAFADVERGQQARHRADQISGKVGRDLLDHVARQQGDMLGQDVGEMGGAAGGEPPLPALARDLDDAGAAVDRALEQAARPAASGRSPRAASPSST